MKARTYYLMRIVGLVVASRVRLRLRTVESGMAAIREHCISG
jgi:hypothetical protein